jgi:hypothetical protein
MEVLLSCVSCVPLRGGDQAEFLQVTCVPQCTYVVTSMQLETVLETMSTTAVQHYTQ